MSIKKNDLGKWVVDIQPGGRASKRVRKICGTKAEALAWERKARLSMEATPPWHPQGADRRHPTGASRHVDNARPKAGVIYLMRCPTHAPEVFKVGFTTSTSTERALQLSKCTSSPGRFVVLTEWHVQDARTAERVVHDALRRFVCQGTREFFRAEEGTLRREIDLALNAPSPQD